MFIHASCAARFGAAAVLIGAPNAGKSKLLVRLLHDGYTLVGDDCLYTTSSCVVGAESLTGFIERRGFGIVSGFAAECATPMLLVHLGTTVRLPQPSSCSDLPSIIVSADDAAAVATITLALRCALGELRAVAGAME